MREYFEKIENKSEEIFLEEIKNKIQQKDKMFIITANPETLMFAEKDVEFKKIIMQKNVTVVADGIGILKGAKMLNIDIKNRIMGVELSSKLLEYSNECELSVYLFGAKKEVIEKLKEIINVKYPNLKLVGVQDGYIEEKEIVINDMKEKEPDVILVALGVPEQEKLIARHYNEFKKGVFVGVGGSFDVISGMKKRAPKVFLKLNLEWLYRITTEPKRLKRFFESNVKYIFKVYREKRR